MSLSNEDVLPNSKQARISPNRAGVNSKSAEMKAAARSEKLYIVRLRHIRARPARPSGVV